MFVVDFRKEKILLNESFLKMLGHWTKKILKHMYGKDVKMVGDISSMEALTNLVTEDKEPQFVIRGKYGDVEAYAKAIMEQKRYLDAYMEFGKDHPQTAKARANLRTAVTKFESALGLRWPFKDEE